MEIRYTISHEQWEAFRQLSSARDYLASFRGTSNLQTAIARNQAIRLINDARFDVIKDMQEVR